ncbi:unnamed protein product [Oncorhynchus mykiss]|uniref:guanylate cyclase n=1 Tax=Oncorhynchus mykiss TaxID=8022 RepID=A0A060YRX7_ONCMY|nr:unnamed protein product [Oncorhynchus mykiss]
MRVFNTNLWKVVLGEKHTTENPCTQTTSVWLKLAKNTHISFQKAGGETAMQFKPHPLQHIYQQIGEGARTRAREEREETEREMREITVLLHQPFTNDTLTPPLPSVSCRSKHTGYLHYTIGQLRQMEKQFYDTDIHVEVLSEQGTTHNVTMSSVKPTERDVRYSYVVLEDEEELETLPITSFIEVFPFNIALRQVNHQSSPPLKTTLISSGYLLSSALPRCKGTKYFVSNLSNTLIFINTQLLYCISGKNKNVHTFDDSSRCLKLKGQMRYMTESESIIFLGTPPTGMESLSAMFKTGLYINDLSMHESGRALVLAL